MRVGSYRSRFWVISGRLRAETMTNFPWNLSYSIFAKFNMHGYCPSILSEYTLEPLFVSFRDTLLGCISTGSWEKHLNQDQQLSMSCVYSYRCTWVKCHMSGTYCRIAPRPILVYMHLFVALLMFQFVSSVHESNTVITKSLKEVPFLNLQALHHKRERTCVIFSVLSGGRWYCIEMREG